MSNIALPAIAELAQLDQWVVSKPVRRRNKIDKPPFSPHTRRMCSHSNPEHWGSYKDAQAAREQFGFSWLGIVFHEADPYSGADLDGCAKLHVERITTRDDIEPWALRIIDLLNSYTEVSPSGRGVKIIVRGTVAQQITHSLGEHKGVEIYSTLRYFTITGEHLPGTPTAICEAQPALDTLASEYKPTPAPEQLRPATTVINLQSRQSAGRASLADVKARFNAEHSLASLLEGYSARETKDGYSCPFCTHTHDTTLYISKQGRLFSYSPNCKLHTSKGWDAFGLYCKIEHNDNATSAAKALNPIEPHTKRERAPLQEPEPRRTQTPAQAADAARKRQARSDKAAQIRAAIEQRASQDERLSDSAQLVLLGLLEVAGERDWCRPSVARLVAMLDISERSVFYGLEDLAEFDYIRNSKAPGRTTVRTFLHVQSEAVEIGALHPDLNINTDLYLTQGASEGGAEPPALGEPDTLDTWQIADDCHSADELAFLDAPQIEPQITPAELGALNSRALPAGAVIVRPKIGPYCWATLGGLTGPSRPRTTPDGLLIADAWGLWDKLNVAIPVLNLVANLPQGETLDAPGASYSPPTAEPSGEYTGKPKHYADFATRWAWSNEAIHPRKQADAPADTRILDLHSPHWEAQEEPLVHVAPIEPGARSRYFALRNKAKKTASPKQRRWLDKPADAMMVWLPQSEVQALRESTPAPETAPPSQARAPSARPAIQQGMFGGSQ